MRNNYRNNWFYKMCLKRLPLHIIAFIIGIPVTIKGIMLEMQEISKLNIAVEMLGGTMLLFGGIGLFSLFPKLRKLMKGLSEEDLASLGTFPPLKYYDTFYLTDRFLCAPTHFVLARYDRIYNMSVLEMGSKGDTTYYLRIEHTDGSKSDVRIYNSEAFLREQKEFMALIDKHRAEMNSKQ